MFRTTTRRRDLADVIKELDAVPNFIVRESLDHERQTPGLGLKLQHWIYCLCLKMLTNALKTAQNATITAGITGRICPLQNPDSNSTVTVNFGIDRYKKESPFLRGIDIT